jgi:hypothetical protein
MSSVSANTAHVLLPSTAWATVVGIDVEAIAVGQHLTDHRIDPAEQRLMLQLFIAEPDQRLERNLIAEPVIVAQFQNFGVDEALDQSKNVGIGTALDLAHEPLFIGGQRRERVNQ